MARLGDEKEFKGDMIKERPVRGKDDDADDIAVYGSEDDDVVTGDEMDQDGNYDPEAGLDDGSGNGDDMGSGVDIDFEDDPEEDDLGDFEDDDIDDDGEGLEDDDFDGEESVETKADLFDQLRDILSQIAGFDGSDEKASLDDIDDEELGESFQKFFLGEDHALKKITNEFAESTEFEATDIYNVIDTMRKAESNSSTTIDASFIQEGSHYLCQLIKYKDTAKVINIIEKVTAEQLEDAKADAVSSNENWDMFKRNYVSTLKDPEANLGGDRSKDEERQYLENLERRIGVIDAEQVLRYINESTKDPRTFVFAVEEIQGESFVSKNKQLKESDAKTISQSTGKRKTHEPKVADLPFLGDKMLNAMLGVQFKGQVKPFAQIAADLKKADEKGGYKGKAPKRRGDKSNAMPMKSIDAKREAVKYFINAVTEMNNRQVAALLSAFEGKTKPSEIVSESARTSLETDFAALRTAAEGEGLSESFLKDVDIILETAVKSRVDESARSLDVYYNNKLRKEVDSIQDNVVENLNSYLDYVVENFIKENELAIEEGLRTEIAESLLADVFKVFKEHNIQIPEGKTDLLENANEKNAALEEKAEKEFNRGMAYKKKAVDWMKRATIAEAKLGMTVKNANELERKAMAIREFKDEKDFASKVEGLKRLYFSEGASLRKSNRINNDENTDDTLLETSDNAANNNGTTMMDRYVQASKYLAQNDHS